MTQPNQYDWSLLNRDYSDIVQKVLADWKQLVASDEREPEFQRFLSEYAGMFFGAEGTSLVVSQLQLGTAYRPDFVVAHDIRSGGVLYEFIELKRPCHSPFNNGGTESHPLKLALKQVGNWQARLMENCVEVRERFPVTRAADRRCSFTIIIGRRENSKDWLSERNQLSDRLTNRYRHNIRSYDYLTDELVKRQFARGSPVWLSGDELTLNQLANPFVKAFTDKSWRELVKGVGRASQDGLAVFEAHFLTCSGKEVAKRLKHNALFEQFIARQIQK
ncbi:MAG: DUF4263 domain-containing protein [Verrucomicrobia bacterium]|nr:DUF4263 domain-containing protein [Verrucomicrobiota bacterium]